MVIVGGGLAGVTVARAIRALGDQRTITMLCAETEAPYDRPPLSKTFLTSAEPVEPTELLSPSERESLGIDMRFGVAATTLSSEPLAVAGTDGVTYSATDVVIATGARARRLPSGLDDSLSGVHYLRTIDDARALRRDLSTAKSVVVVGAGFVGLEVAASARSLGAEVQVVEASSAPLSRVLGDSVGDLLLDLHRQHGVQIRCSATVRELTGEGHVSGVILDDGSVLAADVVVVGIGVTPQTDWLVESGIVIDNGVVCDSTGSTSMPGVWAVGDVARWFNIATGLRVRVEQWQTTVDQGRVVAANLCVRGEGSAAHSQSQWDSVPYFWSDQYETKFQFAGHPGTRFVRGDRNGRAIVLYGNGDRLCGMLTVTNPRLLAQGRRLIAAGASWADAQLELLP